MSLNWLDIVIFLVIAGVGYVVIAWVINLGRVERGAEDELNICPDPNCRELNLPDARYCGKCGRDLTKPNSTF